MTSPSMSEWEDEFVWNMRMYSFILPLFTIQTICGSMMQAIKMSKRPMEIIMAIGVIRIALF